MFAFESILHIIISRVNFDQAETVISQRMYFTIPKSRYYYRLFNISTLVKAELAELSLSV